ncbi:hypothetical protein HDU99_000741, partial [Rhizoclosmatium hyalinum]
MAQQKHLDLVQILVFELRMWLADDKVVVGMVVQDLDFEVDGDVLVAHADMLQVVKEHEAQTEVVPEDDFGVSLDIVAQFDLHATVAE